MGLNVEKLVAAKVAVDAIPSSGGLQDALAFLTSKKRITDGTRAAQKFVKESIAAVRSAPGDNLWRFASDEEIAAVILNRIEEKERCGQSRKP